MIIGLSKLGSYEVMPDIVTILLEIEQLISEVRPLSELHLTEVPRS